MKKTSCPSCGAEAVFRSTASVFLVCEFCRSMLVRQDLKINDIGKVASLLDDISPLQLGTEGDFEKTAFSIVGRVQVGWNAGYWNEWYALFADGRQGWIGDAQGSYLITFLSSEKAPPITQKFRPGTLVHLGKTSYEVDDVKEFTYRSCQGELPFTPTPGIQGRSIDLSSKNGEAASVQYFNHESHVYLGRYVEFESLRFKNLRELEGW